MDIPFQVRLDDGIRVEFRECGQGGRLFLRPLPRRDVVHRQDHVPLAVQEQRIGADFQRQMDLASVDPEGRIRLDVMQRLAGLQHRFERAADGAVSAVVRPPTAGRIAEGMDAAEKIARLMLAADRHLASQPARNGVVDPLDDAILADDQHADVHHVEDGLKVGSLFCQRLLGLPALGDLMEHLGLGLFGPLAFGQGVFHQVQRGAARFDKRGVGGLEVGRGVTGPLLGLLASGNVLKIDGHAATGPRETAVVEPPAPRLVEILEIPGLSGRGAAIFALQVGAQR